jgi:hypothetical protein
VGIDLHKIIFSLLFFAIGCSSTTQERKDAIKAAFMKEAPKMRRCYNEEVRKQPGLEGKIVATFLVDNTSKAKNCKTTTKMANPTLEKCVCDAILAAEFPAAPDGSFVDVTYPIVFTDSNKDIPEEYRKLQN